MHCHGICVVFLKEYHYKIFDRAAWIIISHVVCFPYSVLAFCEEELLVLPVVLELPKDKPVTAGADAINPFLLAPASSKYEFNDLWNTQILNAQPYRF